MADREPTKHHYIPEFYLSWWSGDDRRFERYDRPIPSKIAVRRSYPSEAGWVKDLYSSPEDSRGAQWLETQIFQVIDSRAAQVLWKMNAEPPPVLTAAERSAWTVFLRSLLHRTPANLQGTIASGMAAFEAALEDARDRYADLRRESDPDTFDEYKATMTPAEKRRLTLRSLPSIMINPRLGQFMHDMPTRVFTMPDREHDLLLSDDPLARTNGLMHDGGYIAIPISPRKLFVSAYRQGFLDQMAAMKPADLVKATNRWTVESARYFVASRDRSQDRFIRNRFGANLKNSLLQ